MTPGIYDDDRLLAAALGFAPDPELLAAAAQDDDLGRRLEAMHAEVAALGAQVRTAVPDPGPGYTDLADPRWAELNAAISAGSPARAKRSRSGMSRWLRVLAPVAAVLVAVAVGVAVLQNQGAQSPRSTGREAQSDAASGGTAAVKAGTGHAAAVPFIKQVDRFGLIVLARAGAARGALQSFDVIRVLKGHLEPHTLRLHVASALVHPGRLEILMLRPLARLGDHLTGSAEATPTPGTPWDASTSPTAVAVATPVPSGSASPVAVADVYGGEPMSAAADTTDYGSADPVTYSYRGDPAMARELPQTADASSIQLK